MLFMVSRLNLPEITRGKLLLPCSNTWASPFVVSEKYIMEVGFANITPGIKDPSVFNPPNYCQSDLKVSIHTTVNLEAM